MKNMVTVLRKFFGNCENIKNFNRKAALTYLIRHVEQKELPKVSNVKLLCFTAAFLVVFLANLRRQIH